jgi:thiaminase/transcriptional activator TenA
MAPTTRGYTDFLLRVAALGDFAELAAALLPCMWGFSEIGRRLAGEPRPADARYAAWVEMYADPEFAALAEWCRALVDTLATDAGPVARDRMTAAFLTSCRYELAFWEMAWTEERWPDQSQPRGCPTGYIGKAAPPVTTLWHGEARPTRAGLLPISGDGCSRRRHVRA